MYYTSLMMLTSVKWDAIFPSQIDEDLKEMLGRTQQHSPPTPSGTVSLPYFWTRWRLTARKSSPDIPSGSYTRPNYNARVDDLDLMDFNDSEFSSSHVKEMAEPFHLVDVMTKWFKNKQQDLNIYAQQKTQTGIINISFPDQNQCHSVTVVTIVCHCRRLVSAKRYGSRVSLKYFCVVE